MLAKPAPFLTPNADASIALMVHSLTGRTVSPNGGFLDETAMTDYGARLQSVADAFVAQATVTPNRYFEGNPFKRFAPVSPSILTLDGCSATQLGGLVWWANAEMQNTWSISAMQYLDYMIDDHLTPGDSIAQRVILSALKGVCLDTDKIFTLFDSHERFGVSAGGSSVRNITWEALWGLHQAGNPKALELLRRLYAGEKSRDSLSDISQRGPHVAIHAESEIQRARLGKLGADPFAIFFTDDYMHDNPLRTFQRPHGVLITRTMNPLYGGYDIPLISLVRREDAALKNIPDVEFSAIGTLQDMFYGKDRGISQYTLIFGSETAAREFSKVFQSQTRQRNIMAEVFEGTVVITKVGGLDPAGRAE